MRIVLVSMSSHFGFGFGFATGHKIRICDLVECAVCTLACTCFETVNFGAPLLLNLLYELSWLCGIQHGFMAVYRCCCWTRHIDNEHVIKVVVMVDMGIIEELLKYSVQRWLGHILHILFTRLPIRVLFA